MTLAWFAREFSFALPVELYPNIVERLRGTPARLADRLGALPREVLTRRDGDQWSMQEHAGHLLDLEPLELQRLDDYAAGRVVLTPADPQNQRTHEARHNERPLADILRAFRTERFEFVRRLETLDAEFIGRTALHPRLQQSMRVIDLAFFKAEHDDHHLARISELVRLFGK
jgi:DinB superfamily